jgi:hypothetical protein
VSFKPAILDAGLLRQGGVAQVEEDFMLKNSVFLVVGLTLPVAVSAEEQHKQIVRSGQIDLSGFWRTDVHRILRCVSR